MKEEYISFTKNVQISADKGKNSIKLWFIDSYKFLNISLDKLTSFLNKAKLRILQREFCNLSTENFNLLMRKGIFLYEYIDCIEKLKDMCLPPRELFYSSLTGDIVSENDYAHVVNVWQRFSIRTLGEYSDLYLKTDVLLLVNIFENFCDSCELWTRSRVLLHSIRFYVGCNVKTYANQFPTTYRHRYVHWMCYM